MECIMPRKATNQRLTTDTLPHMGSVAMPVHPTMKPSLAPEPTKAHVRVALPSVPYYAGQNDPTAEPDVRYVQLALTARHAEVLRRVRLGAQAEADAHPIVGYCRAITTTDALRIVLEQLAVVML